jgi:hypothetical protein
MNGRLICLRKELLIVDNMLIYDDGEYKVVIPISKTIVEADPNSLIIIH